MAVLVLVGLLASLRPATAVGTARAQSADELWSQPVNVSRSGAASRPRVVSGAGGVVQILWWDQFDGLMTAHAAGSSWTSPQKAPILITEGVGEGAQAEVVRTPIQAMPSVFEGHGNAHAFWLADGGRETGIRSLLHSRLPLGSTTWSEPQEVAETARVWRMTAGADDTLHLLFLRPLHTEEAAAGIYYQRSADGGVSWSAPMPLYQSAYARLIEAEDAHLWVAADDQGRVYATWHDPRLEQTYLAVSGDGGRSWSAAQAVGQNRLQTQATGRSAPQARVILAGERGLLLWQQGAGGACRFYQQRFTPPAAEDVVRGGAFDLALSEPERVLEEPRACPEAPTFYRAPSGALIMVLAGDGLTTSAWNGEQWSEPRLLTFSFEHPELGRQVYLEGLDTALVNDRTVVVGRGTGGDVWHLESVIETWEWAFQPPPPWSTPANLSQSPGLEGLPALAVDPDGGLHAMWGDTSVGLAVEAQDSRSPTGALTYARLEPAGPGASDLDSPQWSRPAQVLQTPDGAAREPTLVAHGDELFALWSGGRDGTIYISQAFVRDAYAASGWSQPAALPMGGATASSPDALVDVYGALHIVYAAPLNEGRGIYYLRLDRSISDQPSADGQNGQGQSGGSQLGVWSGPYLVFDAQEALFTAVDHPALALDPLGTLHVVWVRGSSTGRFPPQSILHARSTDGGLTWSEPQVLAEGAYDWPLVAAPLSGEVHVLWNQVNGSAVWAHRRSLDYGVTWTQQAQVRGFGDLPGPAGLTADGGGNLHLVGLGQDEDGTPALTYAFWRWEEGRWQEEDLLRLGGAQSYVPGAAVALLGPQGRLDAAFRARLSEEEENGPDVLHARRTVVEAAEAPVAAYTPVPTVTPTPAPTALPTATPRPAVEADPPSGGPPTVVFGPLSLPLIAVAGIAVALVIVMGVLIIRAGGARR